jgi:hypothetical protein
MTAALVGDLNAAALCPEIMLSIGFAAPQLQASLTAALAIQASVSITPPTLAVQLEAMLAVIANIQVAIEAGISLGLPGVSISVSAAAELVATATLALGNLSILIGLLGGPSFFVYEFSGGTVSTIGSDLATAITATPPPGLTGASAVSGILIGAAPTPWLAVKPFFGGVP